MVLILSQLIKHTLDSIVIIVSVNSTTYGFSSIHLRSSYPWDNCYVTVWAHWSGISLHTVLKTNCNRLQTYSNA